MRETINTRPESTIALAQFDTTGMAVFAVFERPKCHSLEDSDYEPESSEDDEWYSEKIGNLETRQKRKRLHETETECIRTKTDIQHTTHRRSITLGNAGLRNQNVICYSNAILQAIASCNHLTTLFHNILTDNQ